jgi:hypothetical protein
MWRPGFRACSWFYRGLLPITGVIVSRQVDPPRAEYVPRWRHHADHGTEKGSLLFFVIKKNKFAASICLEIAWAEQSP